MQLPGCSDRECSQELIVKILTAHRCLNPGSVHSLQNWVSGTTIPFTEKLNVEKINETRLHRALDWLCSNHKQLKKYICDTVQSLSTNKIFHLFYDFSYVVFEGKGTNLSAYNSGIGSHILKKKLILSMIVNEEGYPLDWDIISGKSIGTEELKKKVKDIEALFPKTQLTLIFDRGMVSDENLELPFFQKNSYITGLKHNQIKNIVGIKFLEKLHKFRSIKKNENKLPPQFIKYDDNLYIRDILYKENKRCILGFNKSKAIEDKNVRDNRLKKFESEINSINEDLKNAKKDKDKNILVSDVYNFAKTMKVKSFYKIEFNPITVQCSGKKTKSFNIQIKCLSDKIQNAEYTDGLFLLTTFSAN